MTIDANYDVYAYYDPRNYEMLYVGKGKGSRKNAHKPLEEGSKKECRLHAIQKAGIKPLIRVVAANLTADQALLVEKTLIWRANGLLTNVSGGHFADNFRPKDTLHLSLPGFDTFGGVFFANVGHWPHRQWEDGRKYGFLAAGYGRRYSSQLDRIGVDSIVAAYFNKYGYVGIGRVIAPALPASDFRYQGQPLKQKMLAGPDLLHDLDDKENCEYLLAVKWIKSVPQEKAKFRRNAGLFTTQQIAASIANQPITLEFLESEFKVDFQKLLSAA